MSFNPAEASSPTSCINQESALTPMILYQFIRLAMNQPVHVIAFQKGAREAERNRTGAGEQRHVFGGQGKFQTPEIVLNLLYCARAENGNHQRQTLLTHPVNGDLGGGPSNFLCDI